jgi:hypothetical protein
MTWRPMREWMYSSNILDLGTGSMWVVNFKPRPLYPRRIANMHTLDQCFSTAEPSSFRNKIYRTAVSQRLRTTALDIIGSPLGKFIHVVSTVRRRRSPKIMGPWATVQSANSVKRSWLYVLINHSIQHRTSFFYFRNRTAKECVGYCTLRVPCSVLD